jgi:outer membrane protein assembly factor BamB
MGRPDTNPLSYSESYSARQTPPTARGDLSRLGALLPPRFTDYVALLMLRIRARAHRHKQNICNDAHCLSFCANKLLSTLLMVGVVFAGSVAFAQTRGVYPDDSVTARDALVRVAELHAAGNRSEAVRVLQETLDTDAERLLPVLQGSSQAAPDESNPNFDVFVPVRYRTAAMLLATPDLLEAYIQQVGPRAAQMLADGEMAQVERAMALTPAGYEANLRLAQLELEAARFESARLMLVQLENHPLRIIRQRAQASATDVVTPGPGAAEAATLARAIASYIPRDSVVAWATRWTEQAASVSGPLPQRVFPPVAAAKSRTPLDVGPAWRPGKSPAAMPLQSVLLDPNSTGAVFEDESGPLNLSGRVGSWIFPTVYGGLLYATDGMRISAWDASTLTPIWSAQPGTRTFVQLYRGDELLQFGMGGGDRGGIEDTASIAAGNGVVVMAGGIAYNGGRVGDDRIYAYNANDGSPLWSVDPSQFEARTSIGGRENQNSASVRGNIVIDGDTAVVAVKRSGQVRRLSSLYLVGIDLHSGVIRWTRLIGSHGTNPWSRSSTRPESLTLHAGVVYRTDDMGVTGAVEAATGRPLWVRLSPTRTNFDFGSRQDEAPAAYAAHKPLVVDKTLYYIEPPLQGTAGRIIGVDLYTGELRESRDGAAFASPLYLLRAGDYIAGVGEGRVGIVKADAFAQGTVNLSESFATSRIVGRVTACADGTLLLPLREATLVMDPADPRSAERRAVSLNGNTLLVEVPTAPTREGSGTMPPASAASSAGGTGTFTTHLITADNQGLHTYLEWSVAKRLLDERIAAAPRDVSPILTLLDLSTRSDRASDGPALADRALKVINSAPATREAKAARTRLFDLLKETVVASRRAYAPFVAAGGLPTTPARLPLPSDPQVPPSPTLGPGPDQGNESTETAASGQKPVDIFARPPVTDLALLDEYIDRLERAADAPAQSVEALLEKAWLRAAQRRYADAVEAYQGLLIDPTIERELVTVDAVFSTGDAGTPSASQRAGDIAKAKLLELMLQQGPAIYAAFDAEATQVSAQLPLKVTPEANPQAGAPGTDPRLYETIAKRYPVASIAPELWRAAGQLWIAKGELDRGKRSFGQGLAAAEFSAQIGRPDQVPLIAALAGELVAASSSPNDREPIFRLLTRLASDYPAAMLITQSGSSTAADLAKTLLPELTSRVAHARTGAWAGVESTDALAVAVAPAQALSAWAPMNVIARRIPGTSYGSLMMANEGLTRVGLWGTDAIDGQLRLLWSRKFETRPSIIRHSAEQTVLFWPTPGGGYLEAIRNFGARREIGATIWKTADLSIAVPRPGVPGASPDRFATPTDGQVRGDDVVALADERNIIIVQRSGTLVCYDVATGEQRWAKASSVGRVFEAEVSGGYVVIAGTYLNRSEGKFDALVVSHNVNTGEPGGTLTRTDLGDHPRWLRAGPSGDVIIACELGLLRFDPATSATAWKTVDSSVVGASLGAWINGDRGVILRNGPALYSFNISTGEIEKSPVLTDERVSFPLSGGVYAGSLIFTSRRGMVAIDRAGQWVGADAISGTVDLEQPAVAEDVVYMIESQGISSIRAGAPELDDTLRLYCFSHPSGKLLSVQHVRMYDAPESIVLIDGKVIITTSSITLVVDAPAFPIQAPAPEEKQAGSR